MSVTSVRYSSKVVSEARRLHRNGDWSIRQIAAILQKRHGITPGPDTISRWINPEYSERSRLRSAATNRRRWAKTWTFSFGGRMSDEYKRGFMLCLSEEHVPANSIAKVCTVIFGEKWSRYRVQQAIEIAREEGLVQSS